MTQLELLKLSEPLASIYTQIESDLIANIADYVAQGNSDTSSAQWKMKKLAQMGKLDKQNARLIAEQASNVPDLTEIAVQSSASEAINQLEPGFKELAKMGLIKGTKVPIEESMSNALKKFSKQAIEQLNLVNTVMKYKAKQACRKVIYDSAELENKQEFLNKLNKATGKVVSGIESRQSALAQCLKEMVNKGIPAFVDKAGREWTPEAYINMDIRTTATNTAHQAQFDRMDDYGIDLVQITSHPGSRPKCAMDQGQIYDRTNKSTKYKHWDSTSYGEPDGILGINCGHFAYPFVPGVSTRRYFPTNQTDDDIKLYKQTQVQRQLERDVRKYKQQANCCNIAGDKAEAKKARQKATMCNQKLLIYCDKTGLDYKPDRVRIIKNKDLPNSIAKKSNHSIISIKKDNKTKNSNIIQSEIDKGNVILELNHEKQQKHIKDSPGYIKGKSYLTISESEAAEIIKQQSGKGTPVFDRQGNWKNKEKISYYKQIGVNVDAKTKAETPTTKATIHYSKTGTHLVPRKETSND